MLDSLFLRKRARINDLHSVAEVQISYIQFICLLNSCVLCISVGEQKACMGGNFANLSMGVVVKGQWDRQDI